MIEYIVPIVTIGIYLLLLLVWLGYFIYNKSKEYQQNTVLEEMYNSKSLAKMDYDFTMYDDETARLVSVAHTEGQLTIDDVLIEAATPAEEGLEEITGNYKPE